MNKKVLHINTIDTGGAAIAAIRLHYLLLEKGVDSKILFLYRKNKNAIKESYYFEDLFRIRMAFKFLIFLNKIINRRFTFYKPKVYFNSCDSVFNVKKHFLVEWADIIHLHWVVKFLNWSSFFKSNSKKIIWTCHDMNPFTGGYHYKIGYNNEFKIFEKYQEKIKSKIVQNIDLEIIAPSLWIKDLISNSLIFRNKKVHTIRNPIDSNTFYLKKQKDKNKGITLLFVAENPSDKRKGAQILIDVLNKIKGDLNLNIIGNKLEIDSTINQKQLGFLSDEKELCKVYNNSDYFVIPSIEDNLPNTVSESLLCGTPVIGFNVGGIREMIINNENGFIVNNENELQDLLMNLSKYKFDNFKISEMAKSQINNEKIIDEIKLIYQLSN